MPIGTSIFWLDQMAQVCKELSDPYKAQLLAGEFKDIAQAKWMAGYLKAITDLEEKMWELKKRVIET